MEKVKTEAVSTRPIPAGFKMAWFFLLLVVALVAAGLQLDRQAARSNNLASSVPEAFRSDALNGLAREAYRQGNVPAGLNYATSMVARRPIEAEGASLLSQGLFLSGDQQAGLSALVLSAQRGWRDTYTQIMIADLSAQAEDYPSAADRLLALWRLQHRDMATLRLTERILANPDALAAFARGLNRNDSWGLDFLVWGAREKLNLPALRQVASALSIQKVQIDCYRLSRAMMQLAKAGMSTAAAEIWSELCGRGSVVKAGDFAFRTEHSPAGPLDWIYPPSDRLTSAVEASGQASRLKFTNDGPHAAVLATRLAGLAPGVYRVSLRGEGLAETPVYLVVSCISANGRAHNAGRFRIIADPVSITVPASGCVSQQLSLLGDPGSGVLSDLQVDGH